MDSIAAQLIIFIAVVGMAISVSSVLFEVNRRVETGLDEKTVQDAHLEKVINPQTVIDQWISENPSVKIMILDKGNKITVYSD